jgi:NAD(P)-dependent dehydrogenase (short-subunit alcohol dehydrogenase family)
MNKEFVGKVALVTGCGSRGSGLGNGKAISVAFARAGADVFGCDVNLEAAEETRDIIKKEGGRCEIRATDVARSDQVKDLVEACVEKFGRIDALVNNVGIGGEGGPVDYPEDKWKRDLDVNITAMFLTCRYVIPHMERQGGGSIVNISSISGIRGSGAPLISYETSKAAVLGFSRGVALQYASKKIRSNVVMPGLIATPVFLQTAGDPHEIERMGKSVPLGHLGEAWDVAGAVLYLASDSSKFVTATELIVDGGSSARLFY